MTGKVRAGFVFYFIRRPFKLHLVSFNLDFDFRVDCLGEFSQFSFNGDQIDPVIRSICTPAGIRIGNFPILDML